MASIDATVGQREIDRAAVESAGGMEMGGAAAAADLANALADALAGGDYYDPGGVAAQDIAAQEAEASGFDEDEADYALDMAADAAPATGVVDDFASGGYATAGNQAGGMETFGFNPQHQTSPDFLEGNVNVDTFSGMPASAPAPMTGPETFGDYNQGVAQGYDFANQTAGGTPGYAMPVGTGVEDFTGMPGAVQAAPTSIEESEMGMAAPMGSGGMLSQGATFDPNMPESPGTGAITAGGRTDQESGDLWAGAPLQGGATTGTQDTQQTVMPEELSKTPKVIDQSIMDTAAQLDQKAKAAREKYGTFSKEYQSAQRMANAFKSLDAYSKAYSATQGGSFIGQLISGVMPLGAALKGITGWLAGQGMHSKQTGQDILAILEDAQKTGDLDLVIRETLGGGGPTTEDVEGPKEIRAFIQQYPWAAELDPKYIKYLIDNPAELQDLLGQNAGG